MKKREEDNEEDNEEDIKKKENEGNK